METNKTNRRDFFKSSAAGVMGAIAVPSLLSGCSSAPTKENTVKKDVFIPEIYDRIPEGKPLKAGVIGCGNRGSGAAVNFLDAGDGVQNHGLQITALGDVFPEYVVACQGTLKARGNEVPDANCFVGFDAYKQVIDSGVDLVILAAPPLFRPLHFDYAVTKGKHVFMEKPAAVCPTGIRQVLLTSKKATQMGLSIVTGTALRSSKTVVDIYRKVAEGAIGEIISAQVSRLGGALWYKQRDPKWSDMEYLIRNWVSFCRGSGDFIVEQFVHEIDLMAMFLGEKLPVKAEATGGRQRRQTGDQYDQFSVVYEYDNGMRTHCVSRQIAGCGNKNCVNIYGTKGYADPRGKNKIFNLDGSVMWEPSKQSEEESERLKTHDLMVQEHVRLIHAIRTDNPINEADILAHSTLMAIMGRESAYTGKFITWDEIMASPQNLLLDKYEFGPIPGFNEEVPLPGQTTTPRA